MRGRGEGSIHKHAKSGLWTAVVSVTVNGKRIRKAVYAKTKAEAIEKLRIAQAELGGGAVNADQARQNLGLYLDFWLDNAVRRGGKKNTIASYEYAVEKYLKPHLGSVALSKLTALHIEAMLTKMAKDGKSERVQQHVYAVLRVALGKAVKPWKLLNSNPADGVEPPRPKKKKMDVWDGAEARVFLESVRGDDFEALYRLAIDSGMRQGEMLGLRWDRIDWGAGTVLVDQQVIEVGGEKSVAELKTDSSQRKIHLTAPTLKALRRRQALHLATGRAACPLVFATGVGGPLGKSWVRKHFKKAIAKAEVKPMRFHDLRHVSATLALANNVPLKVVQGRLGHSKATTTLDTYGHALPSHDKEAARVMEEVLK